MVFDFEKLCQQISDSDVYIISKKNCKWCSQLKMDLQNMNVPYCEYELDSDNLYYTCIKDKVVQFTKMQTFPQFFVQGKLFGGYVEFKRMCSTRRFYQILDKIGINYTDINSF